MSCIRFNTSAQRSAMRADRPTMIVTGAAPAPVAAAFDVHPVPALTPSKLRRLGLLSASSNPKIRESVASSPNAPLAVITLLAADTDEGVRSFVARNAITPPDVLTLLASDGSEKVRGFVVLNASAPRSALDLLRNDPSAVVRDLINWRAAAASISA